jgi:hypothetical protein
MKTKILFIAIFLFATVTYSQYNKKDSDFLNQNKSILVNKQKLDSTINYQWNNNLQNNTKMSYEYDNDNKLINKIIYLWNNTSWINDIKISYFYNSLNDFQTILTYSWHNNTWQDSLKEEYTYLNNLLSEKILYSYQYNNWEFLSKYEYSYDNNNNLSLETYYYWDNTNWVNSTKKEYAYDVNNNLISVIYYDYIFSWAPRTKKEYIYDNYNNLITDITYNWITTWEYLWKNVYTYDTNGDQMQQIEYTWDTQASTWTPKQKRDRLFDNNYTFNDLVLPFTSLADVSIFTHKIDNEIAYSWNDNSNNWINSYKTEYFYSQYTSDDINENQSNIILVYPNPTSDFIYIDLPDLIDSDVLFEIYDMMGHKVMSSTINSDTSLDISHLATGIYVYNLKTINARYNNKIVKN